MLATPAIYLNRETPASSGPIAEVAQAGVVEKEKPLSVRGSLEASGSSASGKLGWLAGLNPMTVPIEFFRSTTLGTPIGAGRVLISFLVNGALCLLGLYYFRHVEDSFADVI
jgi:hypothetical protein